MKSEKEIKLKTEENTDIKGGLPTIAQTLSESYQPIREKLARWLLSSSITQENRKHITEELALTGIDFVWTLYKVMIVRINDFRIIRKKLSAFKVDEIFQKIRNIIAGTFSAKEVIVCFPDDSSRLVVLRNYEQSGNLYESTCVKNIQIKVEKETGYFITVSCGEEKNSVKETPASYYEAYYALNNSTGRKREALLKYYPAKQRVDCFAKELYQEEKEFIRCLQVGNREKIAEQLEGFFNIADRTVPYFWQLKYAYVRLIMGGIQNLGGMEVYYERHNEEIMRILNFVNRLDLCDSRECLKQMTQDIFAGSGYNVCESSEAYGSLFLVKTALKYIEKNYGSQIRAKDIAEMLGITPNYFSRIFKAHTNENFVDYLNKLRIKKAMALLKQPKLKIYQIAEMVGFSDYKYFNQIFRKYTQNAPGKFRNQHSEKDVGF